LSGEVKPGSLIVLLPGGENRALPDPRSLCFFGGALVLFEPWSSIPNSESDISRLNHNGCCKFHLLSICFSR
jgi:hypothetical protein